MSAAERVRGFHVQAERLVELPGLVGDPAAWPQALPDGGFLWLGLRRRDLDALLPALQAALTRWCGAALVDLHVADLLNPNLPSQFDFTSWYDLMVFRRLLALPAEALGAAAVQAATVAGEEPLRIPPRPRPDGSAPAAEPGHAADAALRALAAVDTRPVGFAVFDRVLVTVHPDDCLVREHFAQRLSQMAGGIEGRGSRLPTSPSDLMLRMLNHIVDSYLDLRRLLTARLGHLQQLLLDARGHFDDWQVLLESRNTLHQLEDTCEDQRAALQEWLDALDDWPEATDAPARHERDLLRVRARDVQEHIERVLGHVRRLEQSAEAAVQLHFSALGHRTNDIMRTLTVLTALFLPLNLITGFFGMNFDGLPLIHSSTGVWIAATMMLVIATALGAFFWRRRYVGKLQD